MPVRMDASPGYRPRPATVKARAPPGTNPQQGRERGRLSQCDLSRPPGARKAQTVPLMTTRRGTAWAHAPGHNRGRAPQLGSTARPETTRTSRTSPRGALRSTACVTRSAMARTSGAPVGAARMLTKATAATVGLPMLGARAAGATAGGRATIANRAAARGEPRRTGRTDGGRGGGNDATDRGVTGGPGNRAGRVPSAGSLFAPGYGASPPESPDRGGAGRLDHRRERLVRLGGGWCRRPGPGSRVCASSGSAAADVPARPVRRLESRARPGRRPVRAERAGLQASRTAGKRPRSSGQPHGCRRCGQQSGLPAVGLAARGRRQRAG